MAAGGMTPGAWTVAGGLAPGGEEAEGGVAPACAGVVFEASGAPGIRGAGLTPSGLVPPDPEAVLTTAVGLFSVLTVLLFLGAPES